MAYVKIEPTGCGEHKGLVQIRLDMFLDEDNHRYKEYYLELPEIPDGAIWDEKVSLVEWANTFPKVWQNTPFHSHMIYVETDTTEKEIQDIAEAFLSEAITKWELDQEMDLKNDNLPFRFPEKQLSAVESKALSDKASSIKTSTWERRV